MSHKKPAGKAKPGPKRPKKKKSSTAKKLFVRGLRIRGEVVPIDELGSNPAGGVTHVETPGGGVVRIAFSTV